MSRPIAQRQGMDPVLGSRDTSRIVLGAVSLLLLPFTSLGLVNEPMNPLLWTLVIAAAVAGLYALGAWMPRVERPNPSGGQGPVEIGLRILAGVGAIGLAMFAWVALGRAGPRYMLGFL